MNLTCPDCGSVFRIDPEKVPRGGVRARCSVCGGIMAVRREAVAVPSLDPEAGSAPAAPEVAPGSERPVDAAPESAPPAVDAAPPPRPAPSPPEPTPAPAVTEPRPTAQPRVAPRRVNPYLTNDPAQRARRLARALVSDLVAYHPEKREEGLRAGTLKELFRDDIRKSWQEYVEQVGAPLAESTPYFQDALNDVLAGGRRVF